MSKFGKSLLKEDKRMASYYFKHSPFKKAQNRSEIDANVCECDTGTSLYKQKKQRSHFGYTIKG